MLWWAVLGLLFNPSLYWWCEIFGLSIGLSCCGDVQSCLSQLFLHFSFFQNNLKHGFDWQAKSPVAQWYWWAWTGCKNSHFLWIRKLVEGKERVMLGLLSPRKQILHVLTLPKERCWLSSLSTAVAKLSMKKKPRKNGIKRSTKYRYTKVTADRRKMFHGTWLTYLKQKLLGIEVSHLPLLPIPCLTYEPLWEDWAMGLGWKQE